MVYLLKVLGVMSMGLPLQLEANLVISVRESMDDGIADRLEEQRKMLTRNQIVIQVWYSLRVLPTFVAFYMSLTL